MVIFEEPVYSLIGGLVIACIFFAIQLSICLKELKTKVKLIPIYLIILCAALCTALYFGIFGTWSASFLGNINQLIAGILAIVIGGACLGELLAWILYAIKKRSRKKRIFR